MGGDVALRPESIVVCLDMSAEMHAPWDRKRSGGLTRLEVVVSALKNWIIQKDLLAPVDWGIVTFDDKAELALDLTLERDMLLASLDSLVPELVSSEMPFDFSQIDSVVGRDVRWSDGRLRRVVVVFGRSDVVPVISKPICACDALDVIYVHHKPDAENKCQDVYSFLTTIGLPKKTSSFFFETSASLPKLQEHCALLLAHPDLREPQDTMRSKLDYQRPPSYLDIVATPA